MYGMPRYVAILTLPVEYANTASADATSTHGMIARPSSPSVRFTALLAPTITRYDQGMKKMPSWIATSLNIGTISAVCIDGWTLPTGSTHGAWRSEERRV